MLLLKFIIFLCISVIVQLLCAEKALAWGPGVHTVTALSLLDDVGLIVPSIARIITSFQLEYLYGCLAADFFIGKSRRRKAGNLHNWEGGFAFLSEASHDRETAYAYGFLSHLAADVVAHNFFVPNLVRSSSARRRRGHLYWEIKADYFVGPVYTKIARDVLNTDHQGCDELLTLIAGKVGNGLKTKKRLFTQSVKLSDYYYAKRDSLFAGRMAGRHIYHEDLTLMIDLSCRLVRDFLRHPESSLCLAYDPVGRQSLRLAKRERLSRRPFNTFLPRRRFRVDNKFMEL